MGTDNSIDKLLEEILVDAYGEDEQLWAFRQTIEDEIPLPAEGTMIGETVQVTKIDYDGNPQRGLRATCRKGPGKAYEVALEDIEFPEGARAASYTKAYRQWLGVPQPAKSSRTEYREKIRQTALSKPVVVARIVDRVTVGHSPTKAVVAGLVLSSGDQESGQLLRDWELIQLLNETLLRGGLNAEDSPCPSDSHDRSTAVEEALSQITARIHELQLNFSIPSVELLSVLLPAQESST